MRVYGEAYFLINGWMNFVSLLLAAGLARFRFPAARAALAAALGAAYAILAWRGAPWLRGGAALLIGAALMAGIAFGPRGARLFPLVLAAGLFFSGMMEALCRRGAAAWISLLLAGAASAALGQAGRRMGLGANGQFWLIIRYRGREEKVPAFRDSGNLLSDAMTGLPVVVAPEKQLRALFPESVSAADLSSLPPGGRFIRVRTASGSRTLPCFRPERLTLLQGKRKWEIHAMVALSDFSEKRALLPEALFHREEEYHASL